MNPKGLLMLFALLPQFTRPDGWPSSVQLMLMGRLHLINCGVVSFHRRAPRTANPPHTPRRHLIVAKHGNGPTRDLVVGLPTAAVRQAVSGPAV